MTIKKHCGNQTAPSTWLPLRPLGISTYKWCLPLNKHLYWTGEIISRSEHEYSGVEFRLMIALNFKRLLSRPAATIFFMTVGMIFLSYLLRGESRTKPEHQTHFLSMSLRKLNVVLTASNFKKTFLRIEWKMTQIHLTRCQESHPGMGNRNVFLTMSFLHKNNNNNNKMQRNFNVEPKNLMQ